MLMKLTPGVNFIIILHETFLNQSVIFTFYLLTILPCNFYVERVLAQKQLVKRWWNWLQYIGDPIDCIVSPDVPDKMMDTYCWSVPYTAGVSNSNTAHMRLGPHWKWNKLPSIFQLKTKNSWKIGKISLIFFILEFFDVRGPRVWDRCNTVSAALYDLFGST